MELVAKTIGEVWEKSIEYLLEYGEFIPHNKRNILEINHLDLVVLEPNVNEVIHPLYPFSKKFISLHVNKMINKKDDRTFKRIYKYGSEGINQLNQIVYILKNDPTSKEAIISIYNPSEDLVSNFNSPCHTLIYFYIKLNKLYISASLKHMDAWLVGIADLYQIVKFQEIVANQLGLELGNARLTTLSYFICENDFKLAKDTFSRKSVI
ncbi:thymidylate synthase [Robertmurraya kyonggiensis]|uniref:Thymidylate synthase/dCMP hydroxymethylase domain-containing protein n=1 Tax=Robertmurraya kyonggiensis TaxID=1037680 RepID=A0A4U1D986_9BACI|nr:thymidylate synthase [Robertmurraya kyonggiensis]TKC19115.1 hypothetical protein FA727_06095 [Robertmurraya kyonggiensis]